MKTITILTIFLLVLFGNLHSVEAQIFKKLGKTIEKSVERTVERRVDKETRKSTDRVLDSVIDAPKKSKKEKRKQKREEKKNKNTNVIGGDGVKTSVTNGKARSAKDFIPGNKVIYSDHFLNDAIGDFPISWNTNSSGEVVTFNNDSTKWLQLESGGQYTPDGITEIPENCSFEFDLTVTEKFNYYSDGIWVNIIEAKNRKKDFTKWSRFSTGQNGVRFRIKPHNFEYTGESAITTYVDGEKIIENGKNTTQFTLKNNVVHVAFWRQKNRLRIYLNDEKVWDIPRAFDNANYNTVAFSTSGEKAEHFYVSNLRLAIAGEDTRSALLEKGKFETNEILFDSGKTIIQASSYPILNEIGQILKENSTLKLNIIGHTDSDGNTASNQKLSAERAKSVKEYLSLNFSIAGSRLQTEGKGENNPIDTNSTSEGKAKNRRVEFIKL